MFSVAYLCFMVNVTLGRESLCWMSWHHLKHILAEKTFFTKSLFFCSKAESIRRGKSTHKHIFITLSTYVCCIDNCLIFGIVYSLGNCEQFKIIFVIVHRKADRILWIVECNWIAIHLYSLAINPNTDKPIDIRIRLNINKY